MANRDATARAPERHYGRWIGLALVGIGLFVPVFANGYLVYVADLILIYMSVAIGFNVVVGNLGQLAFANAAFFGIGAYTSGILMANFGVPFWVTLLPSAIVGSAAGVLASLPALRGIRLFYLAIITLAFGELMQWVYIHATSVTQGSGGLPLPTPTFFGLALETDAAKFYVFLAITVAIAWTTSNLLRSRIGRVLSGIRDNELAIASLGVATNGYFMLAFAWSGLVVSIAGSMFAALLGVVVPAEFGLSQLLLHFAIVMIGGVGSLAGSIIGGLVLTAIPELLRSFPGIEEILYASVLILVLLFMPSGIVSLITRAVPALRERFYRG